MGGHLACIHDPDQESFILKLLEKAHIDNVWIGATVENEDASGTGWTESRFLIPIGVLVSLTTIMAGKQCGDYHQPSVTALGMTRLNHVISVLSANGIAESLAKPPLSEKACRLCLDA